MNYEDVAISSPMDFEKTQKFFQNIFNIDQSFPKQVFKKNFHNFLFDDFDLALTSDFYPTLKQLTEESQDSQIVIGMIDPNPLGYFDYLGFYNWLKIPMTIDSSTYGKLMHSGPPQSPLKTLLYIGEVIAWVPPSGKWALWGQRSYGVCVLAFEKESFIISEKSLKGMWRPINQALEELISLTYRQEQIPIDYFDDFLSNYSNTNPTLRNG